MANSIQGNVYVVDSASMYLTGSNPIAIAGSVDGDRIILSVSNIGLYGADTTGELEISYSSDTEQTIYHLKTQAQQGGYDDIHFATPHMVSEKLYVKTITAGTGYIYFS